MARSQTKPAGLIAQKDPAGLELHQLNNMWQCRFERIAEINSPIESLCQRIEGAKFGDTALSVGECHGSPI
jgi:hypothetical protein